MNKKKLYRVIILCFFILIIFISCSSVSKYQSDSVDWNNGYCLEDNGRLNYIGTGGKIHYQCEICGKEYTFDRVNSYK